MNGQGIAALVLALGSWASAQETGSFLRITPGARPMAMGEAFTAVAGDLNALAANPAGLAQISGRHAAFMHAELFEGSRYDFLGYGQNLSGAGPFSGGAVAVGAQRLSYADMEARDEQGQSAGSLSASDSAFSLAYSRSLLGWDWGLGVKWIESRLADSSARGAAFDLGLGHSLSAASLPLRVGMAVQNLGPGVRFEQERENLPLAVSFGGAARVAGSLLISADIKHRPHSAKTSFGVGTEYAVLPALSFRAGYSALSASARSGSDFAGRLGGLGLGFGFKLRSLSLDYAFSPYGELGNAQRVSLGIRL
ncbi:MAG: PorV/PorQ family protein [Elusimicrobia bacterium]|nr:PorV/PorQ family protein [Elusimicrobiota bacterium]